MIQSPPKSFFFFFAKVMKGQKKRSKRLVFRRKSSRKSASHLSRFDLLLGAISLFFIQYTKILRCSQEPIIIVCKCRERKKKLSKGSDYSAVAEQHYPPHLLNCNRKILERQNSLLTLFHHQPQPAQPLIIKKEKKRNFYILQAH